MSVASSISNDRRDCYASRSRAALRLALAGLALVAGGFAYVAWRSPALRLFEGADALGLGGAVRIVGQWGSEHAAADWIAYNLPDGLWLFAFTLTLAGAWSEEESWTFHVWFGVPLGLAFGMELAQLARAVEGTFDRCDLIAYAAAAWLAWRTDRCLRRNDTPSRRWWSSSTRCSS
jgi:hypothetical protein